MKYEPNKSQTLSQASGKEETTNLFFFPGNFIDDCIQVPFPASVKFLTRTEPQRGKGDLSFIYEELAPSCQPPAVSDPTFCFFFPISVFVMFELLWRSRVVPVAGLWPRR